ncbi:hypothetical protein GH714_020969 [Hevea brasiliensis]|uniref:Thiol methyltransferase 2 n=1 Tax=Hevea brasiliensis TaxID=3981 RepID=A0A6A6LD87_HEVBR|nr:hypothetical protein GH714_020969 [Hevea brasiliensis]
MRSLSFRWLSNTILSVQNPASANRAIPFRGLGVGAAPPRMDKKREEQPSAREITVKFKPEVNQMQRILDTDSSGGWEKCWEQGLTPWDLGQPTPVLLHLHHTGALPKGKALVPGCGSGHDVVAIACPERYIVGLDISEKAIKKAEEIDDHIGGPPYKVSVSDYEEVLCPLGFKAVSLADNEMAIKGRKRH